MDDKKNPGKFTIRFNIADPQQQTVVELLNRRGRYKAQFITSAVLLYAYAASDAQAVPLLNGAAIQHIVADAKSCHQKATPIEGQANTDEAVGPIRSRQRYTLGERSVQSTRKTLVILLWIRIFLSIKCRFMGTILHTGYIHKGCHNYEH